MNTHSVVGTRSIKSASLATLCAGALALTACGGGGSGAGMSTFCERVVTLGHTVTAAQNLPDYTDLSKGETKTLISQAQGVAKAAPAEIKDAATALSNQIEMAAADGSEDDVKLQSAGDAIDSYAGDHCTEAGGVKTVSAVTATTSTTVADSGSSWSDTSDTSYGDDTGSSYGDTSDTSYGDDSSTVAPDDSSSCIRDSAGNCDPSNGFDQINQVP
jgi:hypothetical protein